ncbi:MAG: phosphogluconate dehydratase [Hirschia sp.]|nr:phosphogluconate dehydratase [Hirschia sp.]MBF19982.1 phosphogluconate dehydratase [Hirschia sp.]
MQITPVIPALQAVTERITERSRKTRETYLDLIDRRRPRKAARSTLTEGNLAHAAAACPAHDKASMLGGNWPNLGIVTAYNDMLSAHQPFERFPELIRVAAREVNATAQVAGGVPAMCDGVTQGQEGMEMSLFSRDVIAMATAVSLSHDAFDASLYLGVCDKIVPGLMIGALRFGWLPAVFVPAGPMPSGLPNPEKQKIRQQFAAGEVDRDALLKAEAESYHAPGTCTFYGTANTNQMLMELMGLHLPGSAFVNPNTPLRDALTTAAAQRALAITEMKGDYTPIGRVVDEKSIVNGLVGLMATGGSTNHALHIPAIARAAGIHVNYDDLSDIAKAVPLICRIYPNGPADVNHFHAAGGMALVTRQLLEAGLLHNDVTTIAGEGGLARYAEEPFLEAGAVTWREGPAQSGDENIIRKVTSPFAPDGGLRVLSGPLGRGVIKMSAVKPENRKVKAPARVFEDQIAVRNAFNAGELEKDVVIVVRFQGPRANGMPELHGLSPILGGLLDKGYKVAMITDGRMSGASGKFPAVIHLGPEALNGGPISKLRDGDIITLDPENGILDVEPSDFANREPLARNMDPGYGLGRELFAPMRAIAGDAESGGGVFGEMDGDFA